MNTIERLKQIDSFFDNITEDELEQVLFRNGSKLSRLKTNGNNIRGNRANFIYYPIYPCTTTKNGRKVFYKVS
jgi:hypothetical protein